MDRELLLRSAADLFAQHNLTGWKIEFRTRTGHWLGRCMYLTRTILINDFYARHNPDEEVLDTLLHEIAHALTPGHAHDSVWKACARRLGATPNACCEKDVAIRPGKYQATCPSCGRKYFKFRKPRYRCHSAEVTAYYCARPTCGKERGRLVFVLQGESEARRAVSMRNEQIQIADKTRRADELVVPDILYLGVIVDKDDQGLLEYAYRSAIRIHMLILTRERNRKAIKRQFRIDVPDLDFVARKLRKHEREELVSFMVVFQALVGHLLPKAVVESYFGDGGNLAGMRYSEVTWV